MLIQICDDLKKNHTYISCTSSRMTHLRYPGRQTVWIRNIENKNKNSYTTTNEPPRSNLGDACNDVVIK
jgi:hypothetical protein